MARLLRQMTEYKNHQLATCLSFIQLLKQDASKVSINTTGGQLYDFKIVLSSPDVPHEFTYMFSRTKNPFTMDVDGLPNHISELHSLVVRAAPKTINNAIRYVKQNEEFIRQFPADNSPDYY